MKEVLLILLVLQILPAVPRAQEPGYLYIEAEPSRPFYLRTRDSLYSSSQGNYLILAPLRKMVGEVIVGFPGSSAAFSFTIKDTTAEQGLLLRDLKEEGWRLVDFRRNELLNVRRLGRQANELATMTRRNDAFALRLSQVVNDSIILYSQPSVKGPALVARPAGKPAVQPDSLQQPASVVPVSRVRRLSKMDLGTRWLLLYEERTGDHRDTISVEIDKPERQKKPAKRSVTIHLKAAPSGQTGIYEQVFYRINLSWNQLRRLSEAG